MVPLVSILLSLVPPGAGGMGGAKGGRSGIAYAAGGTIRINDVTVAEGNAGTVNATFTVTLSAASTQTVTVRFATADGTAVAV